MDGGSIRKLTTECNGLNLVLPNSYVEVLALGPQNVTAFRDFQVKVGRVQRCCTSDSPEHRDGKMRESVMRKGISVVQTLWSVLSAVAVGAK